jgi:putative tryptophan/tyrosine transport system substrate-binding protein
MRRRTFVSLLGKAAASSVIWPFAALAQQSERVRRIGVIAGNLETDPEEQIRLKAFRQQLAELAWSEGRNVTFDYRFGASDADRIQSAVRELMNLKPDVVLTSGTPLAFALQKQTRSIPVVFTLVADPVASGLVASLARPGENMTGFTNYEYTIGGKWVELLRESAPLVRRILAIENPENAGAAGLLREIEAGALSFGLTVTTTSVLDASAMQRAVEGLAREAAGALVVFPDAATSNARDLIVQLASRHRLPAIYPFRYFALSGGLISYGIDTADQFRRAAAYVDLILKGAKPGELPVQAPTKFELVINLQTAKALGLDIPLFLQQRADEVIE